MTEVKGTTVKIFLNDGTADGLRVIEKSNWTGRLISCSRAQFSAVKRRAEFGRAGVYVLLGYDEEKEFPVAYVGEGDPVLPRLEAHDRAKDFWTEVVVFTSKDENLNKAHIQYLESRLVEIANTAKRARIENGNSPQKPTLSESDVADMESILNELRLLFSVLGIKIFDVPSAAVASSDEDGPLLLKADGDLLATGADLPEGFVVFQDSRCLKREGPSFNERGKKLRANLIQSGVLKVDGDHLLFTQDYAFTSPSLAAFIILGRSSNGRTEWRDVSGKSLKEIQEAA